MPQYQLKIADLCNICIGFDKQLLPKFFDKKTHALHYENLQLYLRLGIKLKTLHRVSEFNQSQQLNNILNPTHKKEYEQKK